MITDQNLEAFGERHRQIWQRLYSILGSAKTGKGDACHELSRRQANQRASYVEEVWGRAALQKVIPILAEIATIEEQAERAVALKAEQDAKK